MNLNLILISVSAGILLGGVAVFVMIRLGGRPGAEKPEDLDALTNRMKESFSAASLDVLSKNSSEFLKLANETLTKQMQMGEKDLEGKKKLIDQSLVAMKEELMRVQNIVTAFEKDREQKFGELSSQLKSTAEQTSRLQDTTSKLRNALSSTTARGQWGQRMAEDILRLVGFIEGVNYCKEKAQETVSTRPDYTFLLPQGLKVNMDVKFPLDNYMRYVETENENEKKRFRDQFLRDAKTRIKEVNNRDYINPEEKTVDYVIVFIPNEQAYAFINENDRSLLDEALRSKVIVCSPLTLYAILAVIRQAVDNFNLEKTAAEILSLLGAFNKQWDSFLKSFDRLGKKIQETQDEFNALVSTRAKQLERPMKKIEELRRRKEIPEIPAQDADILQIENSTE